MNRSVMLSMILVCALVFALSPDMAVAKDLKIRFTDKSKLKYEGDWLIIAYQAYTSKSVGSGKRRGTMTCTPGITGTYQVIAEYKATVNRGTRAQYYVNGSKVKEVSQKADSSSFRKVSLGVFAFTPESTVELRATDGTSYSFVSFTFTTSTEKPTETGDSDTPSSPGSSADSGGGDNSEKSYTADRDGEMTIEPYLSTYQAAELRVLVDGREVLAWVRTNSTTKEPLVFQGKVDDASMVEKKPGDFSPAPDLKYTVALKAGQKVTAVKKGDYEAGTYLKINGPFGNTASLGDLLNGK